eukprot:GHVS01028448.1.p2 GENE.GHVS01028448.1~~GHVS01028448.1.p2  ORF type:complete len:144 (-),score=23.92 GHVS01028448.1:421-852(-)
MTEKMEAATSELKTAAERSREVEVEQKLKMETYRCRDEQLMKEIQELQRHKATLKQELKETRESTHVSETSRLETERKMTSLDESRSPPNLITSTPTLSACFRRIKAERNETVALAKRKETADERSTIGLVWCYVEWYCLLQR